MFSCDQPINPIIAYANPKPSKPGEKWEKKTTYILPSSDLVPENKPPRF
jgi:hypothetical protein